jgi:translation initiation factor 2B subunit (eIF-2B alpha/beta/delta family)
MNETNYTMKTDDKGIVWVSLQPLIKDVAEVHNNAQNINISHMTTQEQQGVISTRVCTRAVLEFLKSLETEQMIRDMTRTENVN